MSENQRLRLALLLLRLGVFVVMLMWTVDKLVRPGHAAGVYAAFYGIAGLGAGPMVALAVAELALLAAFVAGAFKPWSYALVTLLHGVSTLSAFRQYLAPFEGPNLLFFAAWPMLAACVALFLLRDRDTLMVLGKG